MSPALSRALDPLRFRPLLWMAFCALAGVALGGVWAAELGASSRADARLWWPLLPALLGAAMAWMGRKNGFKRRLGVALCLVFAFAASAARRIVAPAGDVSQLVRVPARLAGPLHPVPISARGTVADYPRVSDFSIQFPLECAAPLAGRIWVSAPYGTRLQIGDIVTAQLELTALPTPGDPGERASFWRLVGQGCWCAARKPEALTVVGREPSARLARRVGTWRAALLHHYESAFRGAGDGATLRLRPFPLASAQLMTAMVFGEGGLSRPLPQSLRDDFRAAGLSHVLVASGTQVAFLTAMILWAARKLGMSRAPLLVLVLGILIVYALLAGSAASIWRATIGGVLLAYALCLGRDVDGLSLWGAAILALLALDPLSAWNLSFQLTFAATWGLMTLAPALARLFEARFGRGGAFELAALSLGAQGATLPVSLFHFGAFSAAGLGANFVAVPLAGVMVATGLLGLIAPPVNILNYYLTRGVASLAHLSALLPGARLSGSPLALSWSWACYALFLLASAPLSLDWKPLWDEGLARFERAKSWARTQKPWPLGAALLGLGGWLWWMNAGPSDPQLRVTMLDVGQGESILIRAPGGATALIDGGSLSGQERSDIGAAVIVPALQSLGVDHLDWLILTHSDADHCNGLATVAREIPIGAFLDGPSAMDARLDPALTDYVELRRVLAARGVPTVMPRAGQNIALGAAMLRVLSPSSPLLEGPNDNGIVARLDFGATRFLFAADVERAGEARLLARGADLKCTVLKVGHHGSKTSSTPAFLRAAAPRIALISCGRYNRFGHPNAQTLRVLDAARIATFRTDLSGALDVNCDRATCRVTPFR